MTARKKPHKPRKAAEAEPKEQKELATPQAKHLTPGRKGKPTKINLDTRQAIIEALSDLGDEFAKMANDKIAKSELKKGFVAFLKAAVREDLNRGIKMVTAITPRLVDIDSHHTTTHRMDYKTVAEIDEELARRGARPLREIYALDWKGSPTPVLGDQGVTEAEVIEPQKVKSRG